MNFTKTKLKNGLRIITVPMKGNETVTVMVAVEAGSNYEDKENNGISHFLEHMCFKGTIKRPQSKIINSELDSLGSQSNAFTGNEYTGYWAKAHYSKTEKILDIVSDIYLNSTLPEAELEKERGVIIEEINMYEDLPKTKVWNVYEELLYGGTSAGRTILGPKENIKKISREDFVNYRKKLYTAGATTVIVAGKMNEKKLIKQISEIFEKMPKGAPGKLSEIKTRQSKPQIKIHHKETDQTHLVIGFPAYHRYDKRNTALSMLSTILGGGMSSRLFQKMREELGICYYVRSTRNVYRTHGDFAISAGVSNTRVKEAIKGILEEVRKISVGDISKEELKKAKDYRIGNMFLGLESSDSLADFYGFQELLHDKRIKSPEDFVNELNKITVKDIQKAAKDILRNDKLNLAMIGPFKDEGVFMSILKI